MSVGHVADADDQQLPGDEDDLGDDAALDVTGAVVTDYFTRLVSVEHFNATFECLFPKSHTRYSEKSADSEVRVHGTSSWLAGLSGMSTAVSAVVVMIPLLDASVKPKGLDHFRVLRCWDGLISALSPTRILYSRWSRQVFKAISLRTTRSLVGLPCPTCGSMRRCVVVRLWLLAGGSCRY